MPTAMDSAVIERLAIHQALTPAELTAAGLPGLVLAVLRWDPQRLPVRTVFVVSGPDLPPGLAAPDAGTPVWTTDTSDAALRHAHRALQRATADLAVVLALGEPAGHGLTLVVLRRAAEALAVQERTHALIGRATAGEADPGVPVHRAADLLPGPVEEAAEPTAPRPHRDDFRLRLRPRHTPFGTIRPPAAGVGTDPDMPALLLWSGTGTEDEARTRQALHARLTADPGTSFPAFPDLPGVTVLPLGSGRGAAAPRAQAAPAGPAARGNSSGRHPHDEHGHEHGYKHGHGHGPGRPVRAFAVATRGDAAKAVAFAVTGRSRRPSGAPPRPVVLLLPGQGSQHVHMARGLYGREPVFTAAVDAALHIMGEEGTAIKNDWLGDRPVVGVDDVRRAQPLLFAVDHALARMVLSWGVRPTAILGHSAGELVGAVLAGVFSLPDAVRMVTERVRSAVRVPPGGMLAVAAAEDQLLPYLAGDVAIAAVNAGQQTMLAGSTEPLRQVTARLREDGFAFRAVPATSPFHSPAMAPVAEDTERAFEGIRLSPPAARLYSGYTGDVLTAADALDPRFWGRQVTDTVYFKPALDRLLEQCGEVLLVEAGPGQTLTAFARRHRAVRQGGSEAVPLLPARPGSPVDDRRSVLAAAGRLWAEGHEVDLAAVSRLWTRPGSATSAGRRRIS